MTVKRKFKNRPSLELLEDRCVPATVQYTEGYLLISRPTVRDGLASITVNQVAPNQFQVLDGSATMGTYSAAGTIYIRGGNANDSITFNVNGLDYTGNLIVNDGNGTDFVSVLGGTGSSTGTVAGNVSILTGFGRDDVSLNNAPLSGAISTATSGLVIGGTTQVVSQEGSSGGAPIGGSDSVRFGNPLAVSQFLGNVTVTGYNTVRVGPAQGITGMTQPDVYGGDINVSVGPTQSVDFQQDPGGTGAATITVAGSLRVSGGSGNVGVLTGAMNIGGDLVVNLAGSQGNVTGSNNLSISGQTAGVTTVSGNLVYNGGGNNGLDLAGGVIQGNANINLGNGTDSLALDNIGGAVVTAINGNLNVTKGGGNLNTAPFAPIQATIGGSSNFNVGNGNNTIAFDGGGVNGPIGGPVNIRTGNGSDSILFSSSAGSQFYDANVLLGNGNDSVTVSGAGRHSQWPLEGRPWHEYVPATGRRATGAVLPAGQLQCLRAAGMNEPQRHRGHRENI